MAKRGRPKANGVRPAYMLFRKLIAQLGFDKAKRNGEKYEDAVLAAIGAVRSLHPQMPISSGGVKRILAERQADSPGQTLLVTEDPPDSEQAATTSRGLPESGPKRLRRWTLRFGPCPNHPRSNALIANK